MMSVTNSLLQPPPCALPLALDAQVETRYLANLAGSALSPLPKDIRTKLCEMLFLDCTGCLSSFFRSCHAVNVIWKREFLAQDAECIEKYVESLGVFEKRRIVISHTYGGEALPRPISELLGTIIFDCTLGNATSKRLIDCPSGRLLCKNLIICQQADGRGYRVGPAWVWAKCSHLVSFCKELSTMVWGETQPRYHDISSICPPFLASLEISSVGITDSQLEAFAKKCPHLPKLKLSFCPNISFSGMSVWKSLHSLDCKECPVFWSDEGLRNIARCCPQLTSLRVWSWFPMDTRGTITEDGIAALAEGCPHLTTLDLNVCNGIDGASLMALAEKCPSLRYIHLEGKRLPTLHDCVMLLLAFPGISLNMGWDCDPASIDLQRSIQNHVGLKTLQQTVELAWACAVLGLLSPWLIHVDVLIVQTHENIAQLSDEEITKIHTVCVRFGRTTDSYSFIPLSGEGVTLNEQVAREAAAEVLVEFLADLRQWT